MAESRRGAGVLFFDRRTQRVLLVRRDNIPTIPFPGHLDILEEFFPALRAGSV